MSPADNAAKHAAELLQQHGIPCFYESFDGSIHITDDDGAWWHWGTVAETWCADILTEPEPDAYIGAARTDLSTDCTDPERIAGAIIAALHQGVGVTIWAEELSR